MSRDCNHSKENNKKRKEKASEKGKIQNIEKEKKEKTIYAYKIEVLYLVLYSTVL